METTSIYRVLYRGHIGVSIRMMEKKMEATIGLRSGV